MTVSTPAEIIYPDSDGQPMADNPDDNVLQGWQRGDSTLRPIPSSHAWQSPLLKIRFVIRPDTLGVHFPAGQRFLQTVELPQALESEHLRAE
ncbi:hypothetical protein [Synechococcus sp. PCC 6312]|uniref:hypothetical protein n=1 Tax=Synechococcus sp. (strain ATCC 27167 / PCC 6312) TaxID=195253 RepID=UPI0002F9C1B8|nr:hypothetical protein [Synechococcus sp. PCC 6312]